MGEDEVTPGDKIDKGRTELEDKIQENIAQSNIANEIACLNVKICELVKANKEYEGQVKGLEKNVAKWEDRKAELDSCVQSLKAAKKKMDAERVSKALELSSTKVELELAKRQVLFSTINYILHIGAIHPSQAPIQRDLLSE